MERSHTKRQDTAIRLARRDQAQAPEVEDRVIGKRYDSLENTIHDPWLLINQAPI